MNNVQRLLLLFFIFAHGIVSAEPPVQLYRKAEEHLHKGKAYFNKAMQDTNGGKARAEYCSLARKEYHQATLLAEQYNKATGKGDDLLQQIQMNDYSAFKMAPSDVWSPPERDDDTFVDSNVTTGKSSSGGGIIVGLVIVVGLIGGGVYVAKNSQKNGRNQRGNDGKPRSSRRSQAPSGTHKKPVAHSSGQRQAPRSSGRKQTGGRPSARRSPASQRRRSR